MPEYAVVSCGSGNSYGHPDADTMEKLQSMGIQVLRTDKQGTVTAYSGGNGITWDVSPCYDYTPGNPDDTGTMAGDAGVAHIRTHREKPKTARALMQIHRIWGMETLIRIQKQSSVGRGSLQLEASITADQTVGT